jgi:hypothetical protein
MPLVANWDGEAITKDSFPVFDEGGGTPDFAPIQSTRKYVTRTTRTTNSESAGPSNYATNIIDRVFHHITQSSK